ncbi:hypothetical protein [Streptomyces sp. V3I7]|uniref:hypothetical protein n=1 Tax=Streptomyces sp. V3I7 TaxID=3042278 RepID=UPI0027D8490A|nr:hypothetical protein [Streptomyces sp. V3I7]
MLAVAAGVLVLAMGAGVPQTWWPGTGQAFAADGRGAHQERCARIVGPAKEYCKRGETAFASAEHHSSAGSAWRLVPAGVGLSALVVWRRRSTAGRRRR